MKKQINITATKKHNNFPVTNLKEIDLNYLKSSKTIILRKIDSREYRQFIELRRKKKQNTIHVQTKKFNQEIEILKYQTNSGAEI